ncbi:delta-lactam-biosynthetic de-N-acetylase [Bacillus sp. FJAT-27245]|uniref:delta-lactam-biosynthetic de-N-acetylase n=1 Tax=Bacillus sp. FJAT-27245 TaxID=1684144 RepID=UPI0006A77E2E|nr:delta-lactam-biosynthetic de-N-acetylase [Bacillus sp. FJAT-27245]
MRKLYMILFAVCIILAFIPKKSHGQTSSTPFGWGFKRGQNEQQADAGWQYEALLEKNGAFYKGSPDEKIVYLTFDNGYENGYTEKVLDVLKKEKVPAAFFVTGHYIESAPEYVERMVREGHIVGNHSWGHPDFTKIPDAQIKQELERVRAAYQELTGKKKMSYVRPPRGTFSDRSMAVSKEAGYTHVFWSLAFVDWNVNQQRGWQYSYDNIMRQIHPGAVILLHSVSKDNADALEKVIVDLKAKGYKFKSLDHLAKQQKGK